jgi:uncharacterized membrane protein
MKACFLNMEKINRKEVILLILCLIVGFALRLHTFDQRSLWMDEIHTFNDSRDGLKAQIKFYEENPTYLHPPLFFILTHFFSPFTKPERDLRIIPLIFGTLSIPMIYFLARSFSPPIALLCTVSLTFMTYHISLSQDGRSYSLTMFIAMAALYFFLRYLKTSKKRYLVFTAVLFSLLIHLSYSTIPFVVFSQVFWFYGMNGKHLGDRFSPFLFLNGFVLLLCLPWALFILFHYKGQAFMHLLDTEVPGSFWDITYWILHDWVPHAPLMVVSALLLVLFPFFSKNRKNALIHLAALFLPIGVVYFFCELFNVTHFVSSRYFTSLFPLFLISLYLSILSAEAKFEKVRRFVRPGLLFLILFIASNLVILPLYYRSEKQDLRGLVTYLKANLREGDKIFDASMGYTPGILHYFGAYPEHRHQIMDYKMQSGRVIESWKSFTYQNRVFTIYFSKDCCFQYVVDGSRLWIVVGKREAKRIRTNSPAVLKGFYDGSFRNFQKFPDDGSMYLFLWDPKSPNEKGIDLPIE